MLTSQHITTTSGVGRSRWSVALAPATPPATAWTEEFFEAPEGEIDLLIANGEAGAAWTLLYPGFSVLSPLDRIVSVPLVYPVAGGPDDPLRGFLDHWINLKRQDGTLDELYEYWILGRTTALAAPRWSILRDELGWLE